MCNLEFIYLYLIKVIVMLSVRILLLPETILVTMRNKIAMSFVYIKTEE
jgi:hypothetical protein